jgi:hypothetical protein
MRRPMTAHLKSPRLLREVRNEKRPLSARKTKRGFLGRFTNYFQDTKKKYIYIGNLKGRLREGGGNYLSCISGIKKTTRRKRAKKRGRG